MKPTEILMRLRARFGDETLSKTQVYHLSKSFKEGQRLKTCEDSTFCRKSYGQHFLGFSRHLVY
jgi:hypothetical protein